MKKHKLFITCFFCLLSFTLIAQWEFHNPVSTNAELKDVQFVDTNHGWAVGDFITILRTEDGGNTWSEQLSAADNSWYQFSKFNSVHFSDLSNGWAVGHWYMPYGGGYGGIIFRTENGGETWENILAFEGYTNFCDVQFTDNMHGWVIDKQGKVISTEDGGNTWSVQYSDSTKILHSLCFADPQNGWVTGDEGLILHTSDGGASWGEQISGVTINLSSIFFTDQDNGWAVGDTDSYPRDAKILHTEDGGDTWSVNYGGFSHWDFGKVFFTDTNHGWITFTPAFDGGQLLVTTDGGETWNNQYPGLQLHSIHSVYFINNNIGWATGENVIFNTSNSGVEWYPQNSITNFAFYDVYFIDHENGWAVGAQLAINEGTINWSNLTLHTMDGGNSWLPVEVDQSGSNNKLESVFFSGPYHGWIWGIGETCILSRTTDGGLTWQYDEVCTRALYFTDSLNGWRSDWRYIYKSSDGGVSWNEEFDTGQGSYIYSIFFIDDSTGWAVGKDSEHKALIFSTTDGGINWQEQISGSYSPLYSVCFTDQFHGWAVGYNHTILHTTDGGENWIPQEFATTTHIFNSVCFVDSNKGWITACENDNPYWYVSSSILLFTEDGGENWMEQLSRPFGGLTSIHFIDQEKGWAVGYGGTILHTDNGGTAEIPTIKIPNTKSLLKIYPNPFSNKTTIEFTMPESYFVTLSIYDITGKHIETIIYKKLSKGNHQINWNAEGLNEGVYFIRLKTNPARAGQTTKLIKY